MTESSARPRQLSIGARWTLRNTGATFVLVGIFSFILYTEIERRLIEDGQLILRIQTDEIAEMVDRYQRTPGLVNAYIGQHVQSADPSLRLTIELFDAEGQIWLAGGTLATEREPLPAWRPTQDQVRFFYQFDRGDPYPYLAGIRETPNGLVRVSIYGDRFVHTMNEIRNLFLIALPFVLLLAALLGWWIARQSLRPIATITATARRIRAAEAHDTIPVRGSGDELDLLATTLNEMIERIRRDVERMRRFPADAAHELRTPLSLMRSNAEVVLERTRTTQEYETALRDIIAQVEHLTVGVEALLTLSRSESGLPADRKVEVSFSPLVESVAEFFEPIAREKQIALTCHARGDVVLRGEPVWLHQLISNLVHNAVRYTPKQGRVEVELRCVDGQAELSVRDTGPGVPVAERERVFERFYRGQEGRNREGLGLGLSLVQEIARAHAGSVSVEEAAGGGALFRVTIPLDTGRAA